MSSNTCNNYFVYFYIPQAFSVVFDKAIDRAEPAEELNKRVVNLIDCITFSVYVYTTRGLFEKDKLIFGTQMTFLVSLLLWLLMFLLGFFSLTLENIMKRFFFIYIQSV